MTIHRKIYIFCPGDIISGGVNSLHILGKALRNNGFDVGMYYINSQYEIINNPIILSFAVPKVENIDDIEGNIVVLPETMTTYILQYKYVTKVISWLSVQFFFKSAPFRFPFTIKLLRKAITYNWYKQNRSNKIVTLQQKLQRWNKIKSGVWNNEIFHITNSHFIATVLNDYGVYNPYILLNPVRDEFYNFQSDLSREKIILVGPKTSKLLIRFLRKRLIGFNIIRVRRISPAQLTELYKKSIAFIELGASNRDRAIREAALLGCIVLVSNTGGCANTNDTPLPDFYKIDINISTRHVLLKKIEHICSNYSDHYAALNQYRHFLEEERADFESNAKSIFTKIINS